MPAASDFRELSARRTVHTHPASIHGNFIMDKNQTGHGQHGSRRTMKEMFGKTTDDKRKGIVTNIRKTIGSVKGKMSDEVQDTARRDA